ncbi:MAG: DNA topoisomerase IV subunit B, partial [Candidatus Izemoplasmatales bacterium]
HIQILLITFFFRYMRPLVEEGKVFIALPPLYKITRQGKKEETKYAWNEDERETICKTYKSYNIQRFKGLGEMNAPQLWDTTMNPETRTLVRVTIEDLADAEQRISILMGDNVEPRKEWIDANVSFASDDDFKIKEGQ